MFNGKVSVPKDPRTTEKNGRKQDERKIKRAAPQFESSKNTFESLGTAVELEGVVEHEEGDGEQNQ